MKLSANAEAIFRDMEIQYSRCITRLYEKEYFQAGIDAYTITGYKVAITMAFDNDCITKDEAVHLLEVLKCYLLSISKLLAQRDVMSDDE
jgi:hypothetical protein